MVEFEHRLFQLLLLVGLLNAKPPHQKYTPYIIVVGIMFVFLPPVISLSVPWNLVLGITIPLLLWQNSRRIINAEWWGKWKGLFLWIFAALLYGLMFILTDALEPPSAILFGLIAASMIWRSEETEDFSSFISQFGPLTLVFLLSEVELIVGMPVRYLGGIFSAVAIGVAISLMAFFISQRIHPTIRNWIAIGQIYIAYIFAVLAGVSAIVASIASVIVYVVLGLYHEIWPENKVQPTPFNTWPGFIAFLALFLVLGWQSHLAISLTLVVEVLAGIVIGVLIAWSGRFMSNSPFNLQGSLVQTATRVMVFLFPALLLWPRGSLREPVLLAYALGTAGLTLIISRIMLDYFYKD